MHSCVSTSFQVVYSVFNYKRDMSLSLTAVHPIDAIKSTHRRQFGVRIDAMQKRLKLLKP